MMAEDRMNQLEEEEQEVLSFAKELDEKLIMGEIDPVEYHVMMSEKLSSETNNELLDNPKSQINQGEPARSNNKKVKTQLGIAGVVLVLIALIGIFSQQGQLTPTGFVIGGKQVSAGIEYNQIFSQYTETQLELENITGLRISGLLEGTGARVKLRINGTDYLVAEITNPNSKNLITGAVTGEEKSPYAITTDKITYTLGEAVTITITPETENKSLYISYGEETHLLENNTYTPEAIGEYQAIALIVLADNILRLETNFTVINETITETEQIVEEPAPETPAETTGYEFIELCTQTCTLPETSNPILIIETDENSTLTITNITITQAKENNAPVQTKTIPDITLQQGQETSIDLNQYFTDPEDDTIQYDINEIAEIDATITQNILAISSQNHGVYTAYIYATDGDKLVTSNTFQIIITITETNQTTNETGIITGETNQGTPETSFTDCNDPNPNLRPPECIQGNEEEYFKNRPIYLQNLDRTVVARVTTFGNLILRGKLVENSQATPSSRDFKISYYLNDGETEVTTAWIDTETGDLHLRGRAYEEQFTILPTSQDSFLIQNIKGTNLGFIDRQTGNLFLRGNLVQERPEQDITE
jgi:hypothetical protein